MFWSFNKYVPMEVRTNSMEVKGNTYTYDNSKMIQLLLFGDQLTVARARGASMLCDPQVGKKDTLKAFVPTISDWHTRICLLEVMDLFFGLLIIHSVLQIIWKIFFSKKSVNDKGTLYQLKELIHQTSVGNDPKHKSKSSEDFLLTVLHAHIIAAAKVCCREQNIEDCLVSANWRWLRKLLMCNYHHKSLLPILMTCLTIMLLTC